MSYVIKCLLFLPAAGHRTHGSGELYNVGSSGSYWSGTIYSGYSLELVLNASNVYPANVTNRANGLSVRCQNLTLYYLVTSY